VSLEELLREEVHKQIDKAIEDIPWTTTRLSTSRAKLALQYKDISDFIYGYEYGCIISNSISYCQSKASVGLATGQNNHLDNVRQTSRNKASDIENSLK
jgi:hypothetical protein